MIFYYEENQCFFYFNLSKDCSSIQEDLARSIFLRKDVMKESIYHHLDKLDSDMYQILKSNKDRLFEKYNITT